MNESRHDPQSSLFTLNPVVYLASILEGFLCLKRSHEFLGPSQTSRCPRPDKQLPAWPTPLPSPPGYLQQSPGLPPATAPTSHQSVAHTAVRIVFWFVLSSFVLFLRQACYKSPLFCFEIWVSLCSLCRPFCFRTLLLLFSRQGFSVMFYKFWSILSTGALAHACNPRTLETEAGFRLRLTWSLKKCIFSR